ncbi:MAG: rRNA maturation RNase YbeY [Bacteroidota bacterium]
MSNISFVSEAIKFNLNNKTILKNWIKSVVTEEKKRVGEISFVFCSDDYLLEINKQFLQHDYYTDIISFDYSEEDLLSGDLMISIDRVKENAIEQKVDFLTELNRVMIHGVLHLIGYNDKLPKEKNIMREKEDYYLSQRQ